MGGWGGAASCLPGGDLTHPAPAPPSYTVLPSLLSRQPMLYRQSCCSSMPQYTALSPLPHVANSTVCRLATCTATCTCDLMDSSAVKTKSVCAAANYTVDSSHPSGSLGAGSLRGCLFLQYVLETPASGSLFSS